MNREPAQSGRVIEAENAIVWLQESYASEAGDEESALDWIMGVGSGAASGAATGTVAGPWGALGAAQTAAQQQQRRRPRRAGRTARPGTRSRPQPQRPAASRRPATATAAPDIPPQLIQQIAQVLPQLIQAFASRPASPTGEIEAMVREELEAAVQELWENEELSDEAVQFLPLLMQLLPVILPLLTQFLLPLITKSLPLLVQGLSKSSGSKGKGETYDHGASVHPFGSAAPEEMFLEEETAVTETHFPNGEAV